MTPARTKFAVSRILVALDASTPNLAALDAAVALAARMGAELTGLFVEDVALLRLAESPYAREVLYFSAKEVPPTSASMEAKLRAESERARLALASAAQRARVHWTFRTVRGEVPSAILAAAAEADLLAIGATGWTLSRPPEAGTAVIGTARGGVPALLICEHSIPLGKPVAVYYDGSLAAQRGLLAAALLAHANADDVVIFLVAKDPAQAEALQHEARTLLEETNLRVRYRLVGTADTSGLLKAIEAEKPGTLIFGGLDANRKFRALEQHLRKMRMVILLLDGLGTGD